MLTVCVSIKKDLKGKWGFNRELTSANMKAGHLALWMLPSQVGKGQSTVHSTFQLPVPQKQCCCQRQRWSSGPPVLMLLGVGSLWSFSLLCTCGLHQLQGGVKLRNQAFGLSKGLRLTTTEACLSLSLQLLLQWNGRDQDYLTPEVGGLGMTGRLQSSEECDYSSF